MRIGVFGGSFNPIHLAHIALARKLLEFACLDEVWFVVSPQNPLKKQKELLDENIRYEMVEVALQDEQHLKASDIEFRLKKPSYSWLTLQALSKENPQDEFVLLMGADNWLVFEKWYYHEEILSSYDIVIYPRSGAEIKKESLPIRVSFFDAELIDISSTQIRQLIASRKSIENLVPQKVYDIISSRGLYR